METCGTPLRIRVRRYSHRPGRKAGSSTPALLGAGAVAAGAAVSGAPGGGSGPALHSAAPGASRTKAAATFSLLRRGMGTGIQGSGSLVAEGQRIADRAPPRLPPARRTPG